jgi:hypothetical protein
MTITLDTPVVITRELLASALGEEKVILDMDSGLYYGLDEVGARVWDLLTEPRAPREVCDRIEEEYEVDRDLLESDVLHLVRQFDAEGLLAEPDRVEA